MLSKLMSHLSETAKDHSHHSAKAKEKKQINFDYCDGLCQFLFNHRRDEALEARIRFKIQDLIDMYNKEWRHDIAEVRGKQKDHEGFKKIYVPKEADDGHHHHHSKGIDKKYVYKVKSPKNKEVVEKKKEKPMTSLLQNLIPENSNVFAK